MEPKFYKWYYKSLYCRAEDFWLVYIQFGTRRYMHSQINRNDITYLTLISIIMRNGYTHFDSLCYFREEGVGLEGLTV